MRRHSPTSFTSAASSSQAWSPLFGWFGWRWRNGSAITGALFTAAAFCLEPFVRAVTEKPIRFLDVAIEEVIAGLPSRQRCFRAVAV